jgi:DNA-binding HxlR family transcriptional regulator
VRRVSFDDVNCSIAQSLEQVGDWWTLLIVRDAIFGVTRFEEWQSRLGISRNILTNRLERLVADGIFERRAYQERPLRHEYLLTAKGRALWPVLLALRQWGDRWVTGEGQEPVVMVHDGCGHQTKAHLACDACGERLRGRDLHFEDGPGSTDPDFLRPAGARSTSI